MNKLQLSLYLIFSLVALVIISDFILPGSIINAQIIDLQKERQQYYNAAENSHLSYKVITSEHEIFVTEDFAKLNLINENIEYAHSIIFREVNWYRLHSSDSKSFYSLRIVTGFILPLLTLISIIITFRYKNKIDTLVFILQILLIGDLIFIMN